MTGTKVTLSVSADGDPSPTFQWLKNGVAIPGATSATFTLPSSTTDDSGVYNAIATNSAGWALSNDLILMVDGTSIANIAPSFTLQPFPNATAPIASAITLSATAVGTPTPTYQWLKNGAALFGATNSTLSFPALTMSDSATYSVVATNLAGTATSQGSVLTVVAAPEYVAPSFTLQPVSFTTAQEGSAITLSAAATGTPAPIYQWWKNGAAIAGATNSTLSFSALTTTDAATYSVLATNLAGTALSQDSMLTVAATTQNVAPAFLMHPASRTAALKTSVSFKVITSGTPTPVYQWLKDGVPIPGATNPWYIINAVATDDAGTYVVIAKNTAGSAISEGAVLTVTSN